MDEAREVTTCNANNKVDSDLCVGDDCEAREQAPLTLLERLEREHHRLGERLNKTETSLRHVNAVIARLKEHPEDEAVYDLFKAAIRY